VNAKAIDSSGYNRPFRMRAFFRLVLLALVLLVVALVSALTSMRIAIHGREVYVPNLLGKTPAEAGGIAEQDGLPLEVERQYYSSTVPEGRVLSQVPAAGTKVRRGWQVLVAESLGPQRVQIPNATGESERAAEINIRRRGLDISSVCQIAVPGMPADRVLSQSPPPNASDISAPKISLLVSDSSPPKAFVMPSFIGQSVGTATSALRDAGLQAGKVSIAVPAPDTAGVPTPAPNLAPSTILATSAASVIVSQNPVPGQKVIEGASVNFVVR
jgi:beta-lactam-binding protein with PASTA domain